MNELMVPPGGHHGESPGTGASLICTGHLFTLVPMCSISENQKLKSWIYVVYMNLCVMGVFIAIELKRKIKSLILFHTLQIYISNTGHIVFNFLLFLHSLTSGHSTET